MFRVQQGIVGIGLIMRRCIGRRRWRIRLTLTGGRFILSTPAAKMILSLLYNLALFL